MLFQNIIKKKKKRGRRMGTLSVGRSSPNKGCSANVPIYSSTDASTDDYLRRLGRDVRTEQYILVWILLLLRKFPATARPCSETVLSYLHVHTYPSKDPVGNTSWYHSHRGIPVLRLRAKGRRLLEGCRRILSI
jgi:hypothetical protein